MALDKTIFRETLITRLEETGTTIAHLARQTGVPKTLIDKLNQRRAVATNYADAMAIAAYFGQTLEQFVGNDPEKTCEEMGELRKFRPILDLLSQLSPARRLLIQYQLEGIVHRQRAASRRSTAEN